MNTVSTLASGVVAALMTHKYLEYAYPKKTVEFDNYIKWNTIKAYTIAEMTTKRVGKYIGNNIISPIKSLIPTYCDDKCISFVKYDKEVLRASITEIATMDIYPEYDMILYAWKTPENDDKNDYYMLRFSNVSDITDDFKLSSVKFLGIHIKLEGREPIAVNFGRYNFYIMNNIILDRTFVRWILRKEHDIKLGENDDYCVEFINNEMSCDRIKSGQGIIFSGDDYRIIDINDEGREKETENKGWNILGRIRRSGSNE